jgi:hypothetical protein
MRAGCLLIFLRLGVAGHLLQEGRVVEDEVSDRSQGRRCVVEDLAEHPGHLHLPGGVRLVRVLIGRRSRPRPAPAPTRAAAELSVAELREGAAALADLVTRYRPRVLAVLG